MFLGAGAAAVLLLGSFVAYRIGEDSRQGPVHAPRQPNIAAVDNSKPRTDVTQPASIPLRGAIDVKVWRKEDFDPAAKELKHAGLRLDEPTVLPMTPGDWLRIDVELNRPAFCYIIWIDSEGQVVPLYPWRDMSWTQRPRAEQPTNRVSLPDDPSSIAPLGHGPAGMETLLLLTRDEPLPADVNLAQVIGALPAQQAPDLRSAVWFENGSVVRNEVHRGPIRLDQAQATDSQILRTQAHLRDRLGPLFGYTRGVSFANRGDP